jgi:hypothetical protein
MPRRGQVFTPRAVKIIRGLADQGKSASEIADVIGSDAGERPRQMLSAQDQTAPARTAEPIRFPPA